jgi:opacity protein-like surface antigen
VACSSCARDRQSSNEKELWMRSTSKVCLLCAAAAVIVVPTRARADGYVAPWVGLSAASTNDNGRTAFGVTTGYMAAGVFGFEADVGYSPDFSATPEFRTATAITAMGNFILGVPIGGTHGAGVRPFVTGGLGVTRTHTEIGQIVEISRTNNTFDYNVGVGMMGFFNQHVGLRGDVRYLHMLRDTNLGGGVDLDPVRRPYWRVTGGVTFR